MGPLGTWYRVKVFIEFVFLRTKKSKAHQPATRRTDSWSTSLKTVGNFQSVRFGLHEKVFCFKCLRTNKAKRRTSRTGPASATSGSTTPIRSGPLHERLTKKTAGCSFGGSSDEVPMGGVAWGGVGGRGFVEFWHKTYTQLQVTVLLLFP